MVYVYREVNSQSAREVAQAMDGIRVKDRGRLLRRLRNGDKVVCWGERLAPINGVRILNGGPLSNKFEDAIKLRQENVATIEVARTAPARVDRVTPIRNRAANEAGFLAEAIRGARDYALMRGQLDTTLRELVEAVRAGAGPQHEWVPRLFHHIGGTDLLHPPTNPDYWVKKETFTREFRVHSFMGRSIRAGIKRPAAGLTPHAWIRSYEGNWRIVYDGAEVTQRHRDIAHAAVRALGLDFGAVDIGERADRSVVVLEVNRAAGAEGGTAAAYARAIREWADRRA